MTSYSRYTKDVAEEFKIDLVRTDHKSPSKFKDEIILTHPSNTKDGIMISYETMEKLFEKIREMEQRIEELEHRRY